MKKNGFCSILLGKNINNKLIYAHPEICVHYVFQTTFKEDFLFCETLLTQTTTDEIRVLKELNHFFVENGLNWK